MFESIARDHRPLVVAESTPIQEAVRRALARPRALIYEPLIVEATSTEGPRLSLVDFQDLLLADSRVSALRNRQMGQILSTVQEGFLLVDRGHRIAAEYSKSLEHIFVNDHIAGRRFDHFLADRIDAERAQLGTDYLDTLFDPNVIESLVVQINPLMQVRATMPDGTERHLEFRFRRSLESLGGREVIDRVLVRVEDVTRQVQLAAEVEAQEKKARRQVAIVFDLVQADPSSVRVLLNNLDAFVEWVEQLLASDSLRRRADIHGVFRSAHGLKGEAGLVGLKTFQAQLHRFEDRLSALRDNPRGDRSALRRALDELRYLANETSELLGTLRRMVGDQLEELVGDTTRTKPAADTRPREILRAVARMVDEMADRVGKPARFLSHPLETELPREYCEALRQVLIQLARNSLIHGVETPEERLRLRKPTVATLQLALYVHEATRQLEFVFQDDGAGLDLDAIRRRAAERGLALDETRPEMAIFESGFSTFSARAADSPLDAGRGVGMDLVKELVEEHGGYVQPHSRRGEFCAFQIVLPIPDSVANAASRQLTAASN